MRLFLETSNSHHDASSASTCRGLLIHRRDVEESNPCRGCAVELSFIYARMGAVADSSILSSIDVGQCSPLWPWSRTPFT